MEPTFLEAIWIAAYARAFDRLRTANESYPTKTDAQIGALAAEVADAACANLPEATVAAQRAAIAALKAP